ncbi:hypothetical protein EKK58_09065 [Candidatus Dependentiae bacterium]|nr:MAG: hypothetical protein EKK58_09065 [Candidatus Dependentiae bacterium]
METAGTAALGKVAEYSIVFAVLVAIIAGLLWFIKYLLNELKDSRQENTALTKDYNAAMLLVNGTLTRIESTMNFAVHK